MAIVKVPQVGRTFIMPREIQLLLAEIDVDYARWSPRNPVSVWAPARQVLAAYRPQLEEYKTARGFAGYDIVDLSPDSRGFEEMLANFRREHWRNEDEAHFVLAARGFCNIHPIDRPVVMVELEPGDLLSVGPGVRHWFDLRADWRFRAIRFITRSERAHVNYTGSGIEDDFEPVCMGLTYFPYKRLKPRVSRTIHAA
ncbi:MAG TPA: hypothetical protein VGR81_01460 [Candidatus Acidoferrales bacterium]|nr:hypothetical protein [Candidatus Acidoferrales bacterium]